MHGDGIVGKGLREDEDEEEERRRRRGRRYLSPPWHILQRSRSLRALRATQHWQVISCTQLPALLELPGRRPQSVSHLLFKSILPTCARLPRLPVRP